MRARRLAACCVLAVLAGSSLAAPQPAGAHVRLLAPATINAFVALAERGVAGSFSAAYQVSGGANGGTVAVAQRAAIGRRPFVTGRGTWSFVYDSDAGYASQWIERGPSARDCWRPPGATSWTCSGPGAFRYVNGYLMAVSPYIPGEILGDLNALEGALTSKTASIRKIVATRTLFTSSSPRFGPLQCLRVAGTTACLDGRGVVARATGAEVSGTVTLQRYSPKAPSSAFAPLGSLPSSGSPFIALHQPYVN